MWAAERVSRGADSPPRVPVLASVRLRILFTTQNRTSVASALRYVSALRRQKVSCDNTQRETLTMRRKILPFILGGAMAVATVAPAAAAHTDQLNVQRGGAAGLIAAVVQVAANAETGDILTVTVNDSLNNLLQNADIDVNILRNVLNNALRDADIDVTITDIRLLSTGDLAITFA